jgi:hypothetical protein
VKIMKSGGRPLTVAYTRHYPPDTQACVFWLRNRRSQNWREKVEHEHRDAPGWVAELEAAGERARTLAVAEAPVGDASTPDDAGSPTRARRLHHR